MIHAAGPSFFIERGQQGGFGVCIVSRFDGFIACRGMVASSALSTIPVCPTEEGGQAHHILRAALDEGIREDQEINPGWGDDEK